MLHLFDPAFAVRYTETELTLSKIERQRQTDRQRDRQTEMYIIKLPMRAYLT